MTARTRTAVDSSSSPLPLSTRDTVVLLTFARAATSAMVIGTGPGPPVCMQAILAHASGVSRPRWRCCSDVSEPVSVPVPAVNDSGPGHVNEKQTFLVYRDDNPGDKSGLIPATAGRCGGARCPMGHR